MKNSSYFYLMKYFSPIVLLLILQFSFTACERSENENEKPQESTTTIGTDLSISSTEELIAWVYLDDLNEKIYNALVYEYGNVGQGGTETFLLFNTDTSQVTASIDFKSEFQEFYVDTIPSNNSVTMNLEKNVGVKLIANGPGDTYELIRSVLAPGQNPIETPDCSHPEFGDHIDEIFDEELNSNVFRFHIHTSPDDDRCINFDRQRNEIKSYSQSPNYLLGVEDEKVNYKWKFKLNAGFQASPKFTHFHQLKSVGGSLASQPMYTLTARQGTPDRLELRYAETDDANTLKQIDLAPFIDTWLEVSETILYGINGSYEIVIKRVEDGSILFSYSNSSIINWRPGASFVRPKWGIYRSLEFAEDLRDEQVLFNDFIIIEI